MTSERHPLRALFDGALQQPREERQAYLRQRAGEDPVLLAEVQALLAEEEQLGTFLSEPLSLQRDPPLEELPERVGAFRILELLGEGGMGVVYLAEQDHPKRRVALKLVRGGAWSGSELERRFRNEVDLLGRLEHPGIARLYEAGTADTGLGEQPYFAMELVEGVPLGEYARVTGASLRERVELLVAVADAVQHAHARGVVHRDLKPTNLLVRADGSPVVLDFGIARATGEDHAVTTLQSAGRYPLGTLAYMSPEQVRGDRSRIDARSDVYALGVVLYELLAGELPYSVRDQALHEALRVVLEAEPRLLRDVDPRLEGDLTTIASTCLEKEPDRRYANAGALAEDLRRFLTDRPIAASPPSTRYQLEKLIRRNRARLAAMAVVIAALLVGLAGTLWQARLAGRAAGDADFERRRAEDLALEAKAQAQRAEALALEATEEARRAEAHAEDVMRLSDVKILRDLEARADQLWPCVPDKLEGLHAWVADAEALLARRPLHEERLDELLRGSPRLSEEQHGWWRETLEALLADLEAFADVDNGLLAGRSWRHGWGVKRRIEQVEGLEEFNASEEARWRWEAAIAAIADEEECPQYGGLVLPRQVDLVPVGPDPASGLWEFAHLGSLGMPARDENGRLVIDGYSAIVLVLIPGGKDRIGSQSADSFAPNYDANALEGSVTVEVEHPPYFISKYEVSQNQWTFATGARPSAYKSSQLPGEHQILPVESVSWEEARRVLHWWGLELPTEPEWEIAARGGTDTRWWTGTVRDSLIAAANIADASSKLNASRSWPEYEDGFPRLAPIDTMRANPYGLHHVHGNVAELCLELHRKTAVHAPEPTPGAMAMLLDLTTQGPVASPNQALRVPVRGGSYSANALTARIAARQFIITDARSGAIGLRPARPVFGLKPEDSGD